ncbi:hypothetical protein G9A89_020572 [Geosiphon pyriformis]|nr:hypothetical protein G9A89_020572 [Geosiphon pyriformis]
MGESRTELLAWINDLLQINYTKVEQCGTGAAHCQIIDSIFGDVQMNKVKFFSKHEYEYVANFKVLQTAFDKHKIDKTIPVERLVKCKFQDNLEFLQWLKRYWDTFYPGGAYDAVARRGGPGPVPVKTVGGGGTSKVGAKRPTPATGNVGHHALSAAPSLHHDSNQVIELNKQIDEFKVTVDGLEKERDFYFGKLRDIEILVQQQIDQEPDNQLLKEIQAILYSTEDGFEVPPEGANPAEGVSLFLAVAHNSSLLRLDRKKNTLKDLKFILQFITTHSSRNMTDRESKGAGKWGPRENNTLDPNRGWAAVRPRYEWDNSYEDSIAPRNEALEHELFGEENHVNTGLNFDKYENIKVVVKGAKITPVQTFEEGDLHKQMQENVRLARYSRPTPVQKWAIPIITEGHDLMACAQTGSGKTAAFLVPILSRLFGKAKKLAAPRPVPGARGRTKAQPLVLVIAPTRELATQIFDECRRFTYRSMLRPCVVYGGGESNPQRAELAKGCDVLAATPGRLCDFLDKGIISLQRVKYLVLDEADRMLDMGFEDDIRKIVQKSDLLYDGTRQTLMFSATFPKAIRALAREFLRDSYLFLTVGRVGGTTSDITQKFVYCEDHEKRNTLVEYLLKQPPSRTLIFVKTKRGADSLDDFLYNQNFPTTSIHGDRTQREREDALIAFKNGTSPILIATAVAARGLDIKNVMHVINYDLCSEIDEYVHRIGRTARVGNHGLATTFYNESNKEIAPDLVKILMECKQEIPEFLKPYMNDNMTFDDDLDDDDAPANDSSSYRNTKQQVGSCDQPNTSGSGPSWDNSDNFNSFKVQSWNVDQKPWDANQQQQPPPPPPQESRWGAQSNNHPQAPLPLNANAQSFTTPNNYSHSGAPQQPNDQASSYQSVPHFQPSYQQGPPISQGHSQGFETPPVQQHAPSHYLPQSQNTPPRPHYQSQQTLENYGGYTEQIQNPQYYNHASGGYNNGPGNGYDQNQNDNINGNGTYKNGDSTNEMNSPNKKGNISPNRPLSKSRKHSRTRSSQQRRNGRSPEDSGWGPSPVVQHDQVSTWDQNRGTHT